MANYKSYFAYRRELAKYFPFRDEQLAFDYDFVIAYIWRNRGSEEILKTIEQRLRNMLPR
ncbi:MAG: hypothetical protein NC818_05020 [Candidatus Omnitrophica bacterium]|nr:hypothetical protein [Candidatus Omnitrophota bacterium]